MQLTINIFFQPHQLFYIQCRRDEGKRIVHKFSCREFFFQSKSPVHVQLKQLRWTTLLVLYMRVHVKQLFFFFYDLKVGS